jgi:hypothetical protein
LTGWLGKSGRGTVAGRRRARDKPVACSGGSGGGLVSVVMHAQLLSHRQGKLMQPPPASFTHALHHPPTHTPQTRQCPSSSASRPASRPWTRYSAWGWTRTPPRYIHTHHPLNSLPSNKCPGLTTLDPTPTTHTTRIAPGSHGRRGLCLLQATHRGDLAASSGVQAQHCFF